MYFGYLRETPLTPVQASPARWVKGPCKNNTVPVPICRYLFHFLLPRKKSKKIPNLVQLSRQSYEKTNHVYILKYALIYLVVAK
jgi:hypothetical protein